MSRLLRFVLCSISWLVVACNSEPLRIPDSGFGDGRFVDGGFGDGGFGDGGSRDGGFVDGGSDLALRESVERIEIVIPSGEESFAFDVPAGALGIHMSLVGGGAGDRARIHTVTDSIGHQWISASGHQEGADGTTTTISDGMAALTLPSSTISQLRTIPAGRWTGTLFILDRVGDAVPGPYQLVIAIQRTSDGAFHRGTLDLDLFIPDGLVLATPAPSHAITAGSASTDAAVAARVDAFYAAVKDLVGFDRGVVRFHAIAAEYRNLTTPNLIDAAGRETIALTPNTVSARVVWTNELSIDGNETWGLSPGIPGVAAATGTRASAIIVALSTGPAKGDGMTMLHELGHFAGLRHTTDLGFGLADWFDDTPPCADDTMVMSDCPDSHNLMFPYFWGTSEGGQNVTLNDSQRRVFYAAPIYRGM